MSVLAKNNIEFGHKDDMLMDLEMAKECLKMNWNQLEDFVSGKHPELYDTLKLTETNPLTSLSRDEKISLNEMLGIEYQRQQRKNVLVIGLYWIGY